MAVSFEDILLEVLNSDRETDILVLLEKKGIAGRSFSSEVWLDIARRLKDVELSQEDRTALELRFGFLIRYCGDMEIKSLPPVESQLEAKMFNQVRVIGRNGKAKLVRGFQSWSAASEGAAALEKEHPDCEVQLWTRER